MRRFIIIFFCLVPITSQAGWGYHFTNISLLGGTISRNGQPINWSIDLLYDHSHKSCIVPPTYYGFGVTASGAGEQVEVGIKGLWMPRIHPVYFSRHDRLYPCIVGQLNYLFPEIPPTKTDIYASSHSFNFRSGLAVTGHFWVLDRVNFRYLIQAGYTLGVQNTSPPLTFEFKIGIGFDPARLKKAPPTSGKT